MINFFGLKIHPHGVTVHFPSALYPLAAIFYTLGFFYPQHFFELSTYYVLLAAVTLTPLAYLTGLYCWRTTYKGFRTPLFDKKLILGALLFILGAALVAARTINPYISYLGGIKAGLYVGGIYLAAILPAPLGYLGGKLVFKE